MNESRKKAIENDVANSGSRGGLFDYVDTVKLERLGLEVYKPSRGDNFIRIVAPHETGFFREKVWIHSNIGVNNRVFLCLKKTFDEPCPICEYSEVLKEKGPEVSEVAATLYASRRYLLFVYDVTSPESEEKGLRWFDCPPSLFEDIVKLSKDKRSGEVIDVSDPVDGRDIEFEQNKVKGRIRYEGVKLVINDPLPKEWLEGIPDYADVLLKPDYQKVLTELSGDNVDHTSESEETTKTEEKIEEKIEEKEVVDEKEESTSRRSRRTRGSKTKEEDTSKVEASVKERIDNLRRKVQGEDNDK